MGAFSVLPAGGDRPKKLEKAAILTSQPGFEDALSELETKHHSCSFYVLWFVRLYRRTQYGWQQMQTADGRPIIEQDAFFTLALEAIARKLNEKIAHENWIASQRT